MWRDFGEALVAEWAEKHAGRRPWAWWRYTATEPRRVMSGHELLTPIKSPGDWDWTWRGDFGIPCFFQCRPRGLPTIEAEPAYLRRLRLLSAEEQARLTEADFAPETHDPFEISEGQIDASRGAGA